jgi:para-aminobenzoate synthetase component I
MTSAGQTLADFVEQLPRPLLGIHRARLEISRPFVDVVSRFADETGTIALLSGGALDSARYHILGVRPWLSVREGNGKVDATFAGTTIRADLDPFDVLDALVKRYTLPGPEELLPLSAGLLGYLAYDLKDCLEVLPRTSCDDLRLPRLYMAAPSILVVHDRHDNTTTAHVPILGDGEEAARRRLAKFERDLSRPDQPVRSADARVGKLTSGLSRDEYIAAVEAVRDYIVRGHVYQVNMSQRFETEFSGDAFSLFAGMFEVNPAPFFAFVQAGDHQIVSTSPERFIQLLGKTVETRPIKGTRPRGKTPAQDQSMRRELETSFKDDAELSMIVDLLRNDIGKVCAAGSVRVREHKRVEAYENVYHLVSVVVGELDDDKNAVDLIRATFPGGSITGCPKIRSMEIIDELEPVRRHIYTGSIGYLGFRGTMDLSIAIRTATLSGGRLVFSVGGGCVFDSNPADEYEETLHKGRTLMNALEGGIGQASAATDSPSAHERFGWCNGKFRRVADITVSVEDEGFAYGYGFFETIRVEHGLPLLLDAHVARFRRTWEQLLAAPFPDLTWRDIVEQVVARSGLGDRVAAVKLLAAAGKPGQSEHRMTLFVTAREYTHRLAGATRKGLRLAVYPHRRHSHLADHKTMNYMFQRMAAKWAQEQRADEALILNADGSVSETNTANLLCRIGGKLCRPMSPHVLPGTMEQAVCELLGTWDMPVEQRRITVEELRDAESIILTNALMGPVPVISIDGKALPADVALCARITEALFGPSDGARPR